MFILIVHLWLFIDLVFLARRPTIMKFLIIVPLLLFINLVFLVNTTTVIEFLLIVPLWLFFNLVLLASRPTVMKFLIIVHFLLFTYLANQSYIVFLSFPLQELPLGYGSLNFQQALKRCSAKTLFMYFQAHLNFICNVGSHNISLDFWQKHIKIFSPLSRGAKVCLITYIHNYPLPMGAFQFRPDETQ